MKLNSHELAKKMDECKYLFENGVNLGDLSKYYNVNLSTIHRWLLQTKAKKKNKISIEELLRIRHLSNKQ